MKIILSLFLLLAPPAMGGDALSTSADADLLCFVNKDAKACLAKVSARRPSAEDIDYLEVACHEAGEAQACVTLGDFFTSRTQAEAAQLAYAKACEGKNLEGCRKVVSLHLAVATEGIPSDTLKALVKSERDLYFKYCDSATKELPDCVAIDKAIVEAENIHNRRSCKVGFWLIRPYNSSPEHKIVPLPNSTRDDCIERARGAKMDALGPDVLRILIEPIFDGVEIEGGRWREVRVARERCDSSENRMGESDIAFHHLCFCEAQHFDQANSLALPFGIFGAPVTVASKKIGSTEWYQCGIHFYYRSVKTWGKKAACLATMKTVRQKLLADPSLKTVSLVFDGLCTE